MVVCCNKNAEQYYITHCETGPDRLDKISLMLNFVDFVILCERHVETG